MLVRIVASGVALLSRVWCYPEVVLSETGPLHETGILAGKRKDVAARHELVAHRFAGDSIENGRIDELPGTSLSLVRHSLRLLLGFEHPALDHKGVPVGSFFVYGHSLLFDHRVVRPIYHRVQAKTEKVLVIGRVQTWRKQFAVPRRLPRRDGPGVHDAGELDIHFQAAILTKIPEEAVLIDSNGSDKRDDQAPRAAHLHMLGAEIGVFPERTVVFLVHAHYVRQRQGIAGVIGHVGIEVVDVPHTIASQLQGIRQPAYAIFSHIEGVLAAMARTGITVGHDHLGECRTAENGPYSPLIIVSNVVENEAFARRKAESKPPLLPRDLVPIDSKAWTLGLADLEGFEVSTRWSDRIHCIVSILLRHRHHTVVINANNL